MIILGTNSVKDTGFDVDNSLRFNKGSSDYLNRTFGTSTSEGTWTYSVWLKISDPAFIDNHVFFSGGGASDNRTQLYFGETTGTLNIYRSISGSTVNLESDASFRDPSAWYNLCVQNNAGTVSAYMNGVAVTLDGSSLGTNVINKSNTVHKIGRGATGTYISSYMSEIVFIDGTVVAPTGFGEFDEDSGIWKPIDVSGLTFGNNGFYLEFKQSGTSQNSSGLGADTSGNDNHFAVNNLTAIDQSTDTCTNNFATLNPLDVFDNDGRTLSNGNLDFTTSSGNNGNISGTLAVSGSGKWYFETKILAQSGSTGSSAKFGIVGIRDLNKSTPDSAGNAYYIYSDGRKEDGANTTNSAHPGYVLNDIVQVAFDLDGGNVYFGLNGNWGNNSGSFNQTFGNATAFFTSINTGGFWSAYLNKNVTADNVLTLSANFGSPSFSISSGNTDGDGYGNFEYAVPSGYYALNTKNLAEYG